MAEVTIPFRSSGLYMRIDDGTAITPLTASGTGLIKNSFSFAPERPRENTDIMVNSSGASVWYDAVDSLAGPGSQKFRLVGKDFLNVTDRTIYNAEASMLKGRPFAAPWGSAVSTNPGSGGYRLCYDCVFTAARAKTVTTDFVGTVAVYCSSLGDVTADGEYMAFDVEHRTVEDIAWT